MALLGSGVIAMWWHVPGEARGEFEDWHAHEHFPERLSVPGFRRASRWSSVDGAGGVFVMYELENYEVLSSPPYVDHLNAPTPWSTKMMPYHHGMVRSQCRVLETCGGSLAAHALTLRLSPVPGREGALRTTLASLVGSLATRPGLTGAYLARHERPPIAATTEQRIRGKDREADWVLVVSGYDITALEALTSDELWDDSLVEVGAVPGSVAGLYRLAYSALPSDVASPVHSRLAT
ncbi:MAG: hypothetical protein V4792_04740 [Pseudomonadota bacterium]